MVNLTVIMIGLVIVVIVGCALKVSMILKPIVRNEFVVVRDEFVKEFKKSIWNF